jgi:GAF domain-containing protein
MVKTPMLYETALQQIQEAVYSTLNLQQILNMIVEKTTLTLGARGSSLFVLGEEGEEFKAVANHGLSQSYLSKGPVHKDKSISETLHGKMVLINHAAEDPRIQYPQAAKQEGIGSILSLPLCLGQKVIGVLRVYVRVGHVLSNEAIDFAKALCEMCALAIQNACCYETVEDRHETIMSDVWRWFKVETALHASRPSAVQSLPTAKRQIRL